SPSVNTTPVCTGAYGQEGKFSGPLKPMTFSIFEGQEPSQIIFQFKANPPAVTFELTGETDGIFKIEKDGLLYHTRVLDRETRAVHHLQLAALDSQGAIVDGPVPIIIEVKDINDNRPTFLQTKYEGSVRQNSRPGKPFMYVNATDLDDPATPNGQLFYQIVIQLPKINNVMYFQIDNKTGAISLTPEGSQVLDPIKNPYYNLVVSVKDMGGQNENSFSDTTSVDITVRENIWKAPEPVEIRENLTDPHPIKITQVQWNDPGAHYSLINKEKLPQFPFSIDQEGNIYVTQPLDREEKDSHVFFATAKDENGKPLAYPLEIRVKVIDINDNPPTCLSQVTVFEVQENEVLGSSIGIFAAHDMDEANNINSILKYRLVDQTPKVPSDELFLIDEYGGKVQLGKRSLKKQDSPQYNLTVEVSDIDFKTLCSLQVNVIDINDQIPIFERSDGAIHSKINFPLFSLPPQPLDFETEPVTSIVFKAENPEPLVNGIEYNASSFASFELTVTDVNEVPVFPQQIFQANVSEDTAIGTKVGTVTARDPEGLTVSYSLKDNKRGWLKIDSVTGDIFSTAPLDRETESVYRVQVVATEVGGSSLSSTAYFHLVLMDVNDNPPRLAKDYTGLFFCHPLSAPGSLIFEATDDDQQSVRRPKFTFALGRESLQSDWEVSKINGTHARLSTKHTRFEEQVYDIPILINDGGQPPMEGIVSLSVTFCQCVDGSCFRPAGNQVGIPTVGMAVGILLTTFLVIGIILAVVFIRMRKDKVEDPQSPENKPLRS
uniref:Cadherin 17 n=1 Tax=Rattus norvegicus TaxID=10116 RepID=A0A8I6ANM1_RAT